MEELKELLDHICKQLFNGIKRVDAEVETNIGALEISGYKVGSIFRIDIKPQ